MITYKQSSDKPPKSHSSSQTQYKCCKMKPVCPITWQLFLLRGQRRKKKNDIQPYSQAWKKRTILINDNMKVMCHQPQKYPQIERWENRIEQQKNFRWCSNFSQEGHRYGLYWVRALPDWLRITLRRFCVQNKFSSNCRASLAKLHISDDHGFPWGLD